MNKESTFSAMVKPLIVLVCICVIVGALLGFTNSVTEPIISANKLAKAERARAAVFESAGLAVTGFEEIDCDREALGITGAYRETGGLGYVITAANKGYGGDVTVTVGIDNAGKVIGLGVDVSTETVGVGSRAGESAYTDRFLGLSGSADGVDTLSRATYSSTAVKKGVSAALAAFDAVR